MRRILLIGSLVVIATSQASAQAGTSYIWRGYGGDPYHDAVSTVAASNLNSIHWSTSLDDARSYYGDEVLIHYASPAVTAKNTVVHAYRFTTTVNGSADYDNWRVYGRSGATGSQLWSLSTDYSAPVVWPSDWTSVYPLALTTQGGVVAAGGGGTVLLRGNADVSASPVTRSSFYAAYANYSLNPSAFANIKICTPFTTDAAGDVYFGYTVVGSVPASVANVVGTGGIVRINPLQNITSFVSVENMGIDPYVTRASMNAAPALSRDGNSIYASICDPSCYDAYLVKLDAKALTKQAAVQLLDPSTPGYPAGAINESSASPMVGPDGHVFYGVFGYYWRESHGWMLQFDSNLHQVMDSNGLPLVGSFGWDDTASVVNSSLVPSYTGTARYLILTKYNNYAIEDGNGVNKVAVIDPTSDTISRDRQSGIPVMNEILTVVGPTPDQEARAEGYPLAVCEWCINSAVIDPSSDSAIINSEDGHCYRWSFKTNTLSQAMNLAPATGEAYTSTVIGPDGTVYAINDSMLYAIGK